MTVIRGMISHCFRLGCGEYATHHLRLYAWSPGEPHLLHTAAEAIIPMLFCHAHANEARADQVLDARGWDAIRKTFHHLRRKAPQGVADLELHPVEGLPPPMALAALDINREGAGNA